MMKIQTIPPRKSNLFLLRNLPRNRKCRPRNPGFPMILFPTVRFPRKPMRRPTPLANNSLHSHSPNREGMLFFFVGRV